VWRREGLHRTVKERGVAWHSIIAPGTRNHGAPRRGEERCMNVAMEL
jgi:hypothetical protein